MNPHLQYLTLSKSPLADEIEAIIKHVIRPMIRALKDGKTKEYMVKLEERLNVLLSLCVNLYLTRKANNSPLPSLNVLEAQREEAIKYMKIYERMEAQREATSDYNEKHQIKLDIERDLNVALAPAHLKRIEAKINCMKMYEEVIQMMTEKVIKGINDTLARNKKIYRLKLSIL